MQFSTYDIALLNWLHTHLPPNAIPVLQFVSDTTTYVSISVVLLAGLFAFVKKSRPMWLNFLSLVVLLLLVAAFTQGLKAVIHRDRPFDTYPYIEIEEQDVSIGHEASVSKIGEEQLFYLTSRGLTEAEASTMIVGGFIEPLVKELPMEYAVEMNRLIELQMEGSVG